MEYTSFNAFCLAVGLDLLDTGFKQSEIVFVLKHIRSLLEEQFEWIMNKPPAPTQLIPAEERPNCPSNEENGADRRVFMVLEKLELKEVFSPAAVPANSQLPVISVPLFFHGLEDLSLELDKMNRDFRKALVLELAVTAKMVKDRLAEAPLIKRGRK